MIPALAGRSLLPSVGRQGFDEAGNGAGLAPATTLGSTGRASCDIAKLLEHLRVGQNQHLQFGHNGSCAGDSVIRVSVPTPVRRSAAAVVKLSNVKLL
jgi:hypothetical protein